MKKTNGIDWRRGLMEDLEPEIRQRVGSLGKHKTKGKRHQANWGTVRKNARKRPTPNPRLPLFPGFAGYNGDSDGRSEDDHNERIERMAERWEIGVSLWDGDEADTESFEGTQLNRREQEFITRVLAIRDSHMKKDEGGTSKDWILNTDKFELIQPRRMFA